MRSHFCSVLAVAVLLATGSGVAHASTDEHPFSRDYIAEVVRYLYRWHLDETALYSVADHSDIEIWARRLEVATDKNDRSRFCELLAPRLSLRVDLKKSDYHVPELKVATVPVAPLHCLATIRSAIPRFSSVGL